MFWAYHRRPILRTLSIGKKTILPKLEMYKHNLILRAQHHFCLGGVKSEGVTLSGKNVSKRNSSNCASQVWKGSPQKMYVTESMVISEQDH